MITAPSVAANTSAAKAPAAGAGTPPWTKSRASSSRQRRNRIPAVSRKRAGAEVVTAPSEQPTARSVAASRPTAPGPDETVDHLLVGQPGQPVEHSEHPVELAMERRVDELVLTPGKVVVDRSPRRS